MEYRPNSRPEQSSPLQNATIIWQGPKYLIFDTKDSRLMSYTHWPHDMNPSPDSLSAAGFYYTGIYIIITISHCITIRIFIFESTYDTLFTGQGDGTICFHSGGGLKNWRPADDAWREHALWFPFAPTFVISWKNSYANVGAFIQQSCFFFKKKQVNLQQPCRIR